MKLIKYIFLLPIAFAVTFAVSDIFIRTAHISSVSINEFYEDIGRGRRMNMNYVYFNEGFGINRLNEYRYIGESVPPLKGENVLRVAIVGDSYTESVYVFERDHFGSISENELAEMFTDIKFEFLNFGRGGFDIADSYAYKKNLVDKFNPDFILFLISRGDLNPKNNDPLRPRVEIIEDSLHISREYSEKDIEVYNKTNYLIKNSTLFNMLNIGRKKAQEVPAASIIFDKAYHWFSGNGKIEVAEYTQEEYSEHPITKKIIESLDTAKVVIVNRDIRGLPNEFVKLVKKNDLKYLDLGVGLRASRQVGLDPNYWKVTNKRGHWNHDGHKIVGKEIAEYIANNLLEETSNN